MNVTTYADKFEVQVIPEGEEQFHEFDFECECAPLIFWANGKQVCRHNSWNDEDILDIAEYSLYHTIRQEFDC
jgi:hypothetical protein